MLSVARARLRTRSDIFARSLGLAWEPTLVVTLEPELEDELSSFFGRPVRQLTEHLSRSWQLAFIDKVKHLVAVYAKGRRVCFVVGVEARVALQKLLRNELLSILVVTHQELAPEAAARQDALVEVMLSMR